MAYGYIYKIVNTVNTKVYVGQTTRTLEARWREHLRNCTSKSKQTLHLYTAMLTHGKENFRIELLEEASTPKELNEKEIYWINFYDSLKNGYNMKHGGQDENPMNSEIVKEKHDQKMRSEEVRSKISKSMAQYRATHGFSTTHLQKLSNAATGHLYFGKGNKMTHVSRDDPTKIAQLLAEGWIQADKNNKNLKIKAMATRSVPCYCILNTGETYYFESILEAGQWWFEAFKPFGDTYSEVTYQRKIKASIEGKPITFGAKNRPGYKEVTNIKWYK